MKSYAFDQRVAAIHRLRVNVKTLAAEAKLIRHETKRAGIQYEAMLMHHRKDYLRGEARYAQLALAYVRSKPYRSVEGERSKDVDPYRLLKKIERHWTGWHKLDAHRLDEVKSWLTPAAVSAT